MIDGDVHVHPLPFVDRSPTSSEILWLQQAISTFNDGSGDPTKFGDFVPNWRDYERILRQFFDGVAPEGKQIYDVFVPRQESGSWIGISVKSKKIASYKRFSKTLKAYFELANSPQKMWEGLDERGVNAGVWGDPEHADRLGSSLLDVIEVWHGLAFEQFKPPEKRTCTLIDTDSSRYISVSYSDPGVNQRRLFRIDSFMMKLQRAARWQYRKPTRGAIRSIQGLDEDGESLWDWYPDAGGQLKYYPRFDDSVFGTGTFETLNPGQAENLEDKMSKYWPGTSSVRETAANYLHQ